MTGSTLYKYCCANKSRSQSIGIGVSPNSTLLTDGDINFMGNVLARSDIGNNDMRHQEAIYAIQEVNPTLYQNQAKDLLEQRIFPKAYSDGEIERKTLKVQAATTERTAITYQS